MKNILYGKEIVKSFGEGEEKTPVLNRVSLEVEEELADLRRREMGFVFQQPALLKNLNILDNIILPMMRDQRKNVKGITEKARQLMRLTGIEELADREITQVSGGQLQRAGICRALMAVRRSSLGMSRQGR